MNISPQLRRIIYLAASLVGITLAAFNVITQSDADAIINSVGLLIGSSITGLAAAKVPEAPDAKTTEQRIGDAVEFAAGQILNRIAGSGQHGERAESTVSGGLHVTGGGGGGGVMRAADAVTAFINSPSAQAQSPSGSDPEFAVKPRTEL